MSRVKKQTLCIIFSSLYISQSTKQQNTFIGINTVYCSLVKYKLYEELFKKLSDVISKEIDPFSINITFSSPYHFGRNNEIKTNGDE